MKMLLSYSFGGVHWGLGFVTVQESKGGLKEKIKNGFKVLNL